MKVALQRATREKAAVRGHWSADTDLIRPDDTFSLPTITPHSRCRSIPRAMSQAAAQIAASFVAPAARGRAGSARLSSAAPRTRSAAVRMGSARVGGSRRGMTVYAAATVDNETGITKVGVLSR